MEDLTQASHAHGCFWMALLASYMKRFPMLIVDRWSNVTTAVIVAYFKKIKCSHKRKINKISVTAFANVLGTSITMTGQKIWNRCYQLIWKFKSYIGIKFEFFSRILKKLKISNIMTMIQIEKRMAISMRLLALEVMRNNCTKMLSKGRKQELNL